MNARYYGSFVHALVFGHLRTRVAAIGTRQRRPGSGSQSFCQQDMPWRTHTRLIETTAELGHTLGQIANVDCEDERAGPARAFLLTRAAHRDEHRQAAGAV